MSRPSLVRKAFSKKRRVAVNMKRAGRSVVRPTTTSLGYGGSRSPLTWRCNSSPTFYSNLPIYSHKIVLYRLSSSQGKEATNSDRNSSSAGESRRSIAEWKTMLNNECKALLNKQPLSISLHDMALLCLVLAKVPGPSRDNCLALIDEWLASPIAAIDTKGSVLDWNHLITSVLQNGGMERGVAVFLRMQSAGVSPDAYTFRPLFFHTRRSSPQVLFDLIDRMVKYVSKEEIQKYHAAALKTHIMDLMRDSNISDDTRSKAMEKVRPILDDDNLVFLWNSWLSTTLSSNPGMVGLRKAAALLEKMKAKRLIPNIHTYIPLIQSAVSAGTPKVVLTLVTEAHTNGVRFVGGFYVNLILSLSKNAKLKKEGLECAHGVLQEVVKVGLVRTPHFNAMLKACKRNDNFQLMAKVLEEMKAANVAPSLVTYNLRLAAHSINAELDDATEVLTEMEEAGFKPNMLTLAYMIRLASRVGGVEKGREVFDAHMPLIKETIKGENEKDKAEKEKQEKEKEEEEEGDVAQDIETHSPLAVCGMLMKMYVQAMKFEEAEKILNEVVLPLGLKPTELVLLNLVRDRVMKVSKQPDSAERDKEREKLISYMERFRREWNIHPDAFLLSYLLASCHVLGNHAKRVLAIIIAADKAGRITEYVTPLIHKLEPLDREDEEAMIEERKKKLSKQQQQQQYQNKQLQGGEITVREAFLKDVGRIFLQILGREEKDEKVLAFLEDLEEFIGERLTEIELLKPIAMYARDRMHPALVEWVTSRGCVVKPRNG